MSSSRSAAAVARLLDDPALAGQIRVGITRLEPVARLASGIAGLDSLLDGGLPRGRVSEIVGPASCGKTSLLLSLLAAATQRGEITACVDVGDALHPASAAAAGTDLQRLLWVRPPSATEAVRCTELLLQAGGFGVVALDFGSTPPRRLRSHVWPRLQQAADLSHTPLLVLAPYRLAGSFSSLGVQMRPQVCLWQRGLWPLFDGLRISAQRVRNKLGPEASMTRELSART